MVGVERLIIFIINDYFAFYLAKNNLNPILIDDLNIAT